MDADYCACCNTNELNWDLPTDRREVATFSISTTDTLKRHLAARPLLRVLMLRMMRGSARTRGGVTTSRRVTGGAQEHQSVNAHARGAAA